MFKCTVKLKTIQNILFILFIWRLPKRSEQPSVAVLGINGKMTQCIFGYIHLHLHLSIPWRWCSPTHLAILHLLSDTLFLSSYLPLTFLWECVDIVPQLYTVHSSLSMQSHLGYFPRVDNHCLWLKVKPDLTLILTSRIPADAVLGVCFVYVFAAVCGNLKLSYFLPSK